MPDNENSQQAAKEASQSERAIKTLVWCIVAGFGGIALFALQTTNVSRFFSAFGVAVLISGAFVLVGGLLGFLFGIPIANQKNKNKEGGDNKKEEGTPDGKNSYGPNTNLEQISDWLTKILVGVGLAEISSLGSTLKKFEDFVATQFENIPASKMLAGVIPFFYTICGFLIAYLWTRIYLAGELSNAEVKALGKRIEVLENQTTLDANALSLVQRQLNPPTGAPPIPEDDLNKAVEKASQYFKAQIFYLAEDMRRKNWEKLEAKPIMERTINVFRALIKCDKEKVYHLNHGQLGFALKDQRQPNWKEAEAELSIAIQIRGPKKAKNYLLYEFNRAICRIELDNNFKNNQKADAATKQLVEEDLKAATNNSKDAYMIGLIQDSDIIQKWKRLNP